MKHTIRDPDFERRVRDSFARQQFMVTLGATLENVRPGEALIALPFSKALTQQHGFLHAGVAISVVDSACGYAALSLMEPGAGVMSVEFKVNLLAPAMGNRFVAVGRVVRSGRTLTVCQGELRAVQDDGETLVAVLQGTMMAVRGRDGISD
ncbi:MAG: PaaI family thioesterase [Gemmatimonadota bacterium]